MTICAAFRLHSGLVAIAGAGLLAAAGLASVAVASSDILVSQQGRAFRPGSIDIQVGDTVTVVNDDGDLLHHAYIDSPTFSFDSGDQQPGSKIKIVFGTAGNFMMLCGIHPKMKMSVQVH